MVGKAPIAGDDVPADEIEGFRRAPGDQRRVARRMAGGDAAQGVKHLQVVFDVIL